MVSVAHFRAGQPLGAQASNLGFLAPLAGNWSGTGFNMMFLPDFDNRLPSTGPKAFRMLMNATRETLDFTPISAPVPNRGSQLTIDDHMHGQTDIDIYGLRYLQTISDANPPHDPLHMEPGFWLNVPATTIPASGPTIVRQGAIPHGSTVQLQGHGLRSPGRPTFAALNSNALVKPDPTHQPPVHIPLGYLSALPPAAPAPYDKIAGVFGNPNLVLEADIATFASEIVETTTLIVSTDPAGGVVNIPFLANPISNNAKTRKVEAIFWIEHVVPAAGRPFDVLQYSQTVILSFEGIDWPHTSVATLFRQ